jgi:hydroxyacylglutathione hydrolase
MFLKRFYDEQLAHASYLIGCYVTGEAIVIDPNRNVDQYIQAATDEAMRIVAVTETHIHADFLSGSRELALRAGATLYLSDEGDTDWKYGYGSESNVKLVKHGDVIEIGNIKLDIWHTPGHTPEHISLVVTDRAESNEPLAALTGDFIFVGDVGRPDLLDRVAGYKDTMEKGARVLYQSLQRFIGAMPDHLLLLPAHGAGSACGKALGGVPMSVLGYQKKVNWALKCKTEQEFVDGVLNGQPEPPLYFKEMKRMNKVGPALLGSLKTPIQLLPSFLNGPDAFKIDIRSASALRIGFFAGSIGVASCRLCRSFATWTGWHAPYDKDIIIIANSQEEMVSATRSMESIGLDRVIGWVPYDSIPAEQTEKINLISVEDAMGRLALGEVNILDVRGMSEYQEGHIPGATWIPFGYLESRLKEVPQDKPLVIHCAGGNRSPIAYTVLRKHGFTDLYEMSAGYKGYRATQAVEEVGIPA